MQDYTYDDYVKEAKARNPEVWKEIEFYTNLVMKMVIARTDKSMSMREVAKAGSSRAGEGEGGGAVTPCRRRTVLR